MKRRISFLIVISFMHSALYAQMMTNINTAAKERTNVGATPMATAFGIYGQVPVSSYTGTPEINIPLHNINYRELSINLSLMYHQAIGNKPDLFPGNFGNGWLVTMGGVITRTSKAVRPYEIGGLIPAEYNPTSATDWSSTGTLNDFLHDATDIYDPGSVRYDEFSLRDRLA